MAKRESPYRRTPAQVSTCCVRNSPVSQVAVTAHMAHSARAVDTSTRWRMAQRALGEITGEYSSDDLLGAIFSAFCIGN